MENELEKEFGENNYNVDDTNAENWKLIAHGQEIIIPAGKKIKTSKLASEIFELNGTTTGKMHVGDYVNYPVYYTNVATSVLTNSESLYPVGTYTGWRVLSIEGTGDSQYIKLVSAGVPLNYYHGYDSSNNSAALSVENLTTKFFNIPINSTLTKYNFYKSGFKTALDGTAVTSISDVMELFNNIYTAKYKEGESAIYIDNYLNQTFTNSNVVGQPKVQSITKEDLDLVMGLTTANGTNIVRLDNLFAIPCEDQTTYSKYAQTFLASACNNAQLWRIVNSGTTYNRGSSVTNGIRCTVLLTANVKYSLANGSNSTDTVKIWDIE